MRPSDTIIAAALAGETVTDAEGRRLSLRRLTMLDKLRLFKAAGPELARNGLWLGIALLACSVTAIDDVPVPMPATEAQVEALVARLGDAGIEAVASTLGFPEETAPAALRQDAGNSVGTPT
jgi:hypothetical protein